MPTYSRDQFLAEFDIDEADVASAGQRIDAYVQGWNLAQLRKDAGVTQVQLAQTLGVNQSRISAIEHGNFAAMSLSTIRAYVEALGGKLRLAAEFGDHQVQFPAAA
ncbi:MAG: helix-turn-helix domain-containing protein [Mycobacteriales bacterium]